MRIACGVEVEASPNRVWRFLVEPRLQKLWLAGVMDNVPEDDGPLRPGKRSKMTIKGGGNLTDYDMTIDEVEPPTHLKLSMSGPTFPKPIGVEYRLTDFVNVTKLDYLATCDLPGLLKLFGPLVGSFARMQVRSCLKILKRLAESPEFE